MLELVLFGMLSLLLAAISLFGMEQGGELVRRLAILFSILSAIVNTSSLLTTIIQVISISTRIPPSLEELPTFLSDSVLHVTKGMLLIICETIITSLSYTVLKQMLITLD